MKKIKIIIFFLVGSATAWSQTNTFPSSGNVGIGTTSPATLLNVHGDQTSNRISQSGGTYTELAQRTWSGSAGILFSAYASDSYVDGGLDATGNTKYKYGASVFGSAYHGAKMIYANHSSIGFYISPPSTGADNDVVWGTPIMWLKRGGLVGIGTLNPISPLTIGDNLNTALSASGITLGSDQKSIEFLHSESSNGYGSRIYGVDEGSGVTSLRFAVRGNSSTWTDAIYIKAANSSPGGTGNVGIGTTNPQSKLTVDGKIQSEEVKVEIINGPDYVFEPDYKLRTLKETQEYISANKHLPEIPSAKEMETNGVELGDMNMRLLKKIEELTLYQIELLERIEALEKKIAEK